MLTAKDILQKYVEFYKQKGHKELPNASLVPENDPTTLFTNSGMQPLIPYLAGEPHPEGKRFVNVQNCFRGHGALDDINEVGNNRHLTFFRMQGNWSLGDYFKKEQLTWIFELLTEHFNIDPTKLYVSVFSGHKDIPKDEESPLIWKELFESIDIEPKGRVFPYDATKNWWSRAGVPEKMPIGELGGADSEIFYDFGVDLLLHENSQWKNETCHINCDCGRFLEIGNNVFMEYIKKDNGFEKLPQKNIDFGGGAERFLMAAENQADVYKTSLYYPIIQTIETQTGKQYLDNAKQFRIITDHFVSASFIISAGVIPSNTEQGYILRRLLRRSFDAYIKLNGKQIEPVLEQAVEQYRETDPLLIDKFEEIQNTILTEKQKYEDTLSRARKYIEKRYSGKQAGDDLLGNKEISADDAFILYSTHGLSPTQIESLGFIFDKQKFAVKMEQHQKLSQKGAEKKFAGGLADHQKQTIMGHTATHLLHQALRDVLGDEVHQSGSNITTERFRFDFNYLQKLTDAQIKQAEEIVNRKIKEKLPVHYEILPLEKAKAIGAIGLFDEKYQEKVKVYFIGGSGKQGDHEAYSKEFCGGPHVSNTKELNPIKIYKQESLGKGFQRIYTKFKDRR